MVDEYDDPEDENQVLEARLADRAASSVSGLDDFIKENRHLFTLIGVFGAFSIYLQQADLPSTEPGEIPLENSVAFFGFGIVLLLFLIVFLKLASRIVPSDRSDSIFRPENFPYLVFLLLLLPIATILVTYLSSFEYSAALFWMSLVYLLSPISLYWGHEFFIHNIELHKKIANIFGRGERAGLGLLLGFTAVLSFLLAGIIGMVYGPFDVEQLPDVNVWGLFLAIFVSWWFFGSFVGLIVIAGKSILARV